LKVHVYTITHCELNNCDAGEYPVVRPGSTYSYISCTHFATARGTMHGIYTMRNLQTGKLSLMMCAHGMRLLLMFSFGRRPVWTPGCKNRPIPFHKM